MTLARNTHALYLRDVGLLLKERALEARDEQRGSPNEFSNGRALAYYEVISLLVTQAQTFGLPLDDIQLHDIDPDRDLLVESRR